jgi:XTP/dITP diphosphohydrolase
VLETLGVGGVMRLMYGLRDRSCRFVSALTYIDEQGTLHTFLDESAAGTLSHSVDATVTEVYSDWWRIFIPAGESKPLSALPESERNRLTRAWAVNSVYGQFGRWYTEQLKPPASF